MLGAERDLSVWAMFVGKLKPQNVGSASIWKIMNAGIMNAVLTLNVLEERFAKIIPAMNWIAEAANMLQAITAEIMSAVQMMIV